MAIQLLFNNGLEPYKIIQELKEPINVTMRDLRSGTTTKTKYNNHDEAVYKKFVQIIFMALTLATRNIYILF